MRDGSTVHSISYAVSLIMAVFDAKNDAKMSAGG